MYLAVLALILTKAALPYPFLVVSFVVGVITLGENFDASSRHSAEIPLLCLVLYIFIDILFSYPCGKMVEFHHPGFLFSMVFKLTRLVASIVVVDISGKSHCLTFAPHAAISNLRSQI